MFHREQNKLTAILVQSGDTTDTPKLSVTALSVVGCRVDRRALKHIMKHHFRPTRRFDYRISVRSKRILFGQVEKRPQMRGYTYNVQLLSSYFVKPRASQRDMKRAASNRRSRHLKTNIKHTTSLSNVRMQSSSRFRLSKRLALKFLYSTIVNICEGQFLQNFF